MMTFRISILNDSIGGGPAFLGILCFVLVLGIFPLQVGATPDKCSSEILVDVSDAYGKPRKGTRIRLRTLTGEEVSSIIAAKVRFPDVPCANYILEASSILGSVTKSTMVVHVTGSPVHIRVGLPVRFGDHDGDYGPYTLRVKLSGPGARSKDIWLRLAGTYMPVRLDFVPSRGNVVEALGLEAGLYQIQVFQGAKYLATKEITIDLAGPTEMEIEVQVPTGADTR